MAPVPDTGRKEEGWRKGEEMNEEEKEEEKEREKKEKEEKEEENSKASSATDKFSLAPSLPPSLTSSHPSHKRRIIFLELPVLLLHRVCYDVPQHRGQRPQGRCSHFRRVGGPHSRDRRPQDYNVCR